VQDLFHFADRGSATVLQVCIRRGIAFMPFCSYPGTGSTSHLRENRAAEHAAFNDQALCELVGVGGRPG
jgi:hypothetical protein